MECTKGVLVQWDYFCTVASFSTTTLDKTMAHIKEEEVDMVHGLQMFDSTMAQMEEDPNFKAALARLEAFVMATPFHGVPVLSGPIADIVAAANAYSAGLDLRPRAIACCFKVVHLPHHCAAIITTAKDHVSLAALYEMLISMSSSGGPWEPIDVSGMACIETCRKLPLSHKFLTAVYVIAAKKVRNDGFNGPLRVFHEDQDCSYWAVDVSTIKDWQSNKYSSCFWGLRVDTLSSRDTTYVLSMISMLNYAYLEPEERTRLLQVLQEAFDSPTTSQSTTPTSMTAREVREVLKNVSPMDVVQQRSMSHLAHAKDLLEVLLWPDFFRVVLMLTRYHACLVTSLPILDMTSPSRMFDPAMGHYCMDNVHVAVRGMLVESKLGILLSEMDVQAARVRGILKMKQEMDPTLYWSWVKDVSSDELFLQGDLVRLTKFGTQILHESSSTSLTIYQVTISGRQFYTVDTTNFNKKIRTVLSSLESMMDFATEHTAFLVAHRPGVMSDGEREVLLESMRGGLQKKMRVK